MRMLRRWTGITRRLMLAICVLLTGGTARLWGQAVHINGGLLPTPNSTLTLSASPSSVSFTLLPGQVANGSAPVTINTSWLLGLASTVHLYAYFTTTDALTVSGTAGGAIPSADVLGKCSTGMPVSFKAFTESSALAAGSSLEIFAQGAVLSVAANRSDQLSLEIDLRNLGQLPAGSYSGTLTLQAQAF